MTIEERKQLEKEAKKNNQIFCICDRLYVANELESIEWEDANYNEIAACMCNIPNDLIIKEYEDQPNLTLGDLPEKMQDCLRYGISRADFWIEDL